MRFSSVGGGFDQLGAVKTKGNGPFSFLAPWRKHDLAPGLQIKVRKGLSAVVKNVGTDGSPAWLIVPKRKTVSKDTEAAAKAEVGVLPLIPFAAKGGAALFPGIKKGIERRRALKLNPWESTVAPGEDLVFEGADVGALLIDSDGIRAYV